MKPIDTMTPEEIRVEIAREKGYHVVKRGHGYMIFYEYVSCSNTVEPTEELAWREADIGHWPTDIREAWGLVEEAPGYNLIKSTTGSTVKYRCHLWYSAGDAMTSWTETLPLAISRAWLKWKRGER